VLATDYVVGIGGSSLADGLADLGRSEEALAVDKVTYRMSGNMSDGMRLRRGLDEYAKGQVDAAIKTLQEAADTDHIFWTYHARAVGHQRLVVGELIRMLEERGTEADLAEAGERKAQLQRLQSEEEELRGAALEEARIAMLPRAEKRKARAEARRKSGSKGSSKKATSKKGGKAKGKRGKQKKTSKGQAGKAAAAGATSAGEGEEQKKSLAMEGPADAEEETAEEGDLDDGGEDGAPGTADKESEEEGSQEEDEEEEECCICLSPLIEDLDDPLGLLACGHCLHDACIEDWNSRCLNKGVPTTCPLCRSSLNRL
jgi:hypothetical protein